jgi:PAS domain S-box-containing protein
LRKEEKLGLLKSDHEEQMTQLELQNNAPNEMMFAKRDVEKITQQFPTVYDEMGKKRNSGVESLGDVRWGTHVCQFYRTKEDLIDILVPFFKAGLENNELCIWVTSNPFTVDDAKIALEKIVENLGYYVKKGQIEILSDNQWYTKNGKFDAIDVLAGGIEKEKQALQNGFDGLRITGDTFWIGKQVWNSFKEYEETVNRVIGTHRMLAICSYSLEKCGFSELVDVISNHQFALMKRNDSWEIIRSSGWEQTEKEMKSLMKFLSENPNPVLRMARDGTLLYANKASEPLLDAEGCHINECVVNECKKIVLDTLATQERQHAEVKGKNDRVFYVTFTPIPDVDYVNVYAFDITERKRAEETVRESEERYRILFDEALDGICLADAETGFIIDCNQALADLVCRERAELIGQPQTILHPPYNDQATFSPTFRQHLTSEEGKTLETQVATRTGIIRDVEIKAIHLNFHDRKMLHGIFHDITERKKMENELKKEIDELERYKIVTVGRELNMIELKKEVNTLCEKLGEKPRYNITNEK